MRTVAQTGKIGIALGTSVSGNGHGTIYIPQLCLNNNRSTLMLGACMQKRAMQFNGARVAYSYILSGRTKQEINEDEDDTTDVVQFFGGSDLNEPNGPAQEARVNFKVYVYAEYLKDNLLSQSMLKMETHVNRVEGQNWGKTRLNTLEGGLGVQIGVRVAKNIYWNSFMAASFYYHTKYIQNMHHEKYSPCITLGTNITIPSLKMFN